MLTCINPNIQFKQETPEGGVRKFNRIAVSLGTFLNTLSENGDEPPSVDQLKNEINHHGIEMTKKTKQVFNASANGTTISRSQDENATKTKCKVCVFLKRNAFSPDAWESFSDFQLLAEAEWTLKFEEAPRALGALLALDVDEIINGSRILKRKIANLYPDVDDRVCENYGLLLAMARKLPDYCCS
ncbi:hypothetical protein ACROYT_G014027 [Oculina patagonica]